MEPNLDVGQRLLINKVAYQFHEPERGDIIVFRHSDSKTDYIKRIIGLPGDILEIKGGVVYINGSKLVEPYIQDPPRYTLNQLTIGEDNYFVLGDNRNNSNDSHHGWTVLREDIVGKAWLSIWPPGEWRAIPEYY
jgi:signal peptidase I